MNFLKILRVFNLLATLDSLLLAAASFYLIFNKIQNLPPQIPLWYSRVWGVQRLASPGWLFLIPILIIIVLAINQSIARLLESRALIKITVWSVVVFGVIISYALVRILILVT